MAEAAVRGGNRAGTSPVPPPREFPLALAARYACTIFIGAFLLFQVEPMIAKYLLPWFGGTPTVWTTCLLFFQVLLLGGYLYAHLVGTRLAPRRQMIVHLSLVGICVALMIFRAAFSLSPLLPASAWATTNVEFPVARILTVLAVSIGLPYFALSATAPLLQSWFGRIHPGASPYRLYSLSNLGSLLALLTYPFAVEPDFGLRMQADIWSCFYFAFALGMLLCALPLRRMREHARASEAARIEAPARGARALWLALSACASMLLYGATGQLTQDIAPIPFLWILPLALYLLSFIICFDSERWYRRGLFHPLFGAAIAFSLCTTVYMNPISAAVGHKVLSPTTVRLMIQLVSPMLLMFSGCMVLNGELVRLKPHHRDLTSFYVMVSLGGALGGVFSVIVTPIIFVGFWDFHFAVWCGLALMLVALLYDRGSWLRAGKSWLAIAILAAALSVPILLRIAEPGGIYSVAALAAVVAAALMERRRPASTAGAQREIFSALSMSAAAAVLAVIYIYAASVALHDTLWTERNFYGVLRVTSSEGPDNRWHSYTLMNGRVEHGKQFFSKKYPQMRYYPTGYYGRYSGIGLVMMNDPIRSRSGNTAMRIGVVGLGAGALAAWGRPGDYMRFYEINPAVIKVAADPGGYFTYIRDSSARIQVIPGDARLSMEHELAEGRPQHFDVLVIDAFTGDVIPTHLLTRQAFRIYLRELAPNGVIAVHISNRFLDLRPVLAEDSRILHLRYGCVIARERDMVDWSSTWVLLARNDNVLGQPGIAPHLQPRSAAARIRPWTDDYSNLFRILK